MAGPSRPRRRGRYAAALSAVAALAALVVAARRRWPRRSMVLLYPAARLAFCWIPKVAGHQMASLFNSLNGVPVSASFHGHEELSSFWLRSTRDALGVALADLDAAKGWRFAVFFRDPLERYLSAFLSKCVPRPDGTYEDEDDANCCGPRVVWRPATVGAGTGAGMEEVVAAFERRVASDALVGEPCSEMHWRRQADFLPLCGLHQFPMELAALSFVGSLSKGNVRSQVMQMLDLVNASAPDLVERFFPAGGVAGHQSGARWRLQEFYRNTSIAQAVLELYALDYALLGLPVPEELLGRATSSDRGG